MHTGKIADIRWCRSYAGKMVKKRVLVSGCNSFVNASVAIL